MSNEQMTVTPQVATIAKPARVAKAILHDAIAWVVPWLIAGTVLLCIPAMRNSVFWSVSLTVVATLLTVVLLMLDVRSFKRYGYTEGFRRQRLRVIDPEHDDVVWKARLYEKSVFKLLTGKYLILDVGP